MSDEKFYVPRVLQNDGMIEFDGDRGAELQCYVRADAFNALRAELAELHKSNGKSREHLKLAQDELSAAKAENERLVEHLIERARADREHCKDCCCARSWRALGITEHTGKSIPEHITALRALLRRWADWYDGDNVETTRSIVADTRAAIGDEK